jgi:hypothetical protein
MAITKLQIWSPLEPIVEFQKSLKIDTCCRQLVEQMFSMGWAVEKHSSKCRKVALND